MKLQACIFQRASTVDKAKKMGIKTKAGFAVTWETGVALVDSFNDGEVHYIIDEKGEKVPYKEMYTWRLSNKLALSAIDTKYEGP